jgi:hypothetical protein
MILRVTSPGNWPEKAKRPCLKPYVATDSVRKIEDPFGSHMKLERFAPGWLQKYREQWGIIPTSLTVPVLS